MTISLTLRQRLICLGLLIGIAPLAVRGAETDDARYHWFSVPIDLSGLPPDAQFVPVSCPIDLTKILSRWNVSGAVDEQSLRLFRLLPDGTQAEQPVQFTGAPQPGPKTRRLLPDTASGVSYLTARSSTPGEIATRPRRCGNERLGSINPAQSPRGLPSSPTGPAPRQLVGVASPCSIIRIT